MKLYIGKKLKISINFDSNFEIRHSAITKSNILQTYTNSYTNDNAIMENKDY